MLHSKYDEDLGKAKDVTKQVVFKSSTIKNISDQKQFKAPNKIDHNIQMYSEYKNLAPVEGTDWMSQNDLKQPKTITPRKLQRKIKAPKNYGFDMVSYALQVVEEINSFKPTTYQVAISCYEVEEQTMAMKEEMESLQKNQTQDLVELPKGKGVVGFKWIFKKKHGSSVEEVIYYKAHMVTKGYSQKKGVSYNDIFFLAI